MVIPVLHTPFRSAINPYVHEADEQVIHWVRDLGLATGTQWVEGYRASKFTWFAARCFPDADLPQLALAAAFNVWLFLFDDSCDDVPKGQKYDYVRAASADLCLALAGYLDADAPLAIGLSDLWGRLKQLSSPGWQGYFTRGMYRYLDACKLEAQWLDTDAWPGLAAYTRYRPYLGAVHLEPALAEVLCGHQLHPAQRQDPRIETLTLLCCRVVCWSNDLFSLDKEWANGDRCNLAIVLAHERQYDLADAVRDAAAIHDEDVRRFASLAGEVLSETTSPTLAHYIRSLQHIVAANMDWSIYDTRRYRFTFEEARFTA
jgi:hypothetical protein